MKLTKFMCAAFAAAIALASCQKQDTPATPEKGEEQGKIISVSLSNVQSIVKSKSLSTDVLSDFSDAEMPSAYVNNFQVFLSDGTNLYQGLNANGSKAPHYFTVENNSFNQVFHYVVPAVNQVIVVANMGAEIKLEDVNTVEALLQSIVKIEDQQNVNNLVLYGIDTELTVVENAHSGESGAHQTKSNVHTAEVELAPLVARIEVTDFTAMYSANNPYKSVTVDQIAFNDYFTEKQLNNTLGTTHVDKSTEQTDMAAFFTGLTGWAYDSNVGIQIANPNFANGGAAINVTVPVPAAQDNDTQCYAYNFFPTSGTLGTENGYPQLVVGLTSTDAQDRTAPQYLATKKFNIAGQGTFTGFQPGFVYEINFAFPDSALQNTLVCVDVAVTVKKWQVVALVPEF